MAATALSLSQEKLKTMLMQNFGANEVCFWRRASGEWKNQKKRHPVVLKNILCVFWVFLDSLGIRLC